MNKFIKATALILLVFAMSVLEANKKKTIFIEDPDDIITIDFKDLKITELIKISSKILRKNILLTSPINGKIDFIKTKPVRKSEIVDILIDVLENKGYTLVGNGNTLRIVRATDASRSGIPIIFGTKIPKDIQQMVTEFIDLKRENVDVISSKIKHLSSRYGKILTNRNTNTLIITDYPKNIKVVKKAIKILERSNTKKLVTVKVKNVSLNSISNEIRQISNYLFGKGILENQVKILVNKDISSIILIGNENNVKYLVGHIKMIDEKSEKSESVTEVIYLQNADSKNILKIIQPILTKKRYKYPENRPYLGSDDEANRILIIGPKRNIAPIKELIKKLDISQQQVYVKAQIIEINKKRTNSIGLKYGARGLLESSNKNMLLGLTTNIGGSLPSSVKHATAIGASIDFLVDQSAARIISEPSIICINNKESTIKVAETISIVTSTSSTVTTTKSSIKREDVGITLKVKPRISSDTKVTLDIHAIISDVLEGSKVAGSPTTTKREIKASTIVNHGESVIVGGLIRKRQSKGSSGIPLLSDLPLIGYLFSSKADIVDDVNLVIILTPYIIPQNKTISDLSDELAELEELRKLYLTKIKSNYHEKIQDLKDNFEDFD